MGGKQRVQGFLPSGARLFFWGGREFSHFWGCFLFWGVEFSHLFAALFFLDRVQLFWQCTMQTIHTILTMSSAHFRSSVHFVGGMEFRVFCQAERGAFGVPFVFFWNATQLSLAVL